MGKRKATKYPGVQSRESSERRYRGRPDICYTIDYRDASGRRIRKDVGWASQGFTAALAAEMRSRLVNEAKTEKTLGPDLLPRKTSTPTFEEAWKRYEKDWLIPKGKKTATDASMISLHLKRFLRLKLDEISPLLLDQLMNDMRAQGKSPQTICHAVALVRRIMRKMAAWRLYSGPLPFDAVAMPKPNNARVRFLSPLEARALLAELQSRSHQTWLMALVSLHCGLRFGEIAALRWENIDFANSSIFIPESKSGRARHAVMTCEVKDALLGLGIGRGRELVFPARGGGVMRAVSDAFNRAVDALGLNGSAGERITDRRQRVVFHTLRHTYASWLAREGQSQLAIADMLGHSSLDMTKRYTHLMDETRRASAEAISRIFHDAPPENQ